MIRPPTINDVDRLVELGVEFGEKSRPVHTMSVDAELVRDTIYRVIENKDSIGFVLEEDGIVEGFIYGVILRTFFSHEWVLQELAWYSRRQVAGLRLMKVFEEEAKQRGIKKIVMGSKPEFCDLRKIYIRKGYRLFEEQFIKEI